MPLSLPPKNTILDTILSSILAGNIVSDIGLISVTRQFSEGAASTIADLYYALYTMLQGWYITTAEGQDLDVRGNDFGLARDAGEAASDPVLFTALQPWIDDIVLASPQVVQATLSDGTTVLYRSQGDFVLRPSGRSISGQSPTTTVTAGVNDALTINLDGDGGQTISLGTQTTATGIAAALQAAVQALAALDPSHQPAYTQFRCDFGLTTANAYTLRSGTYGPSSSVVVTPAGGASGASVLKLGLANGGIESIGQDSLSVPVVCDVVGILGNVGAGQINQLVSAVPGIVRVANPLMFSNGREPASDDAYKQDLRSYILSLGRGTRDSIERAVAHTVSADGARHVMSSQVVYGSGTLAAYLCDGRSLTIGAQADTIMAVQDELDGLGQEAGGWLPAGTVAGAVSAPVLTVDVSVLVRVGPTPDLARAKNALTNAIYQHLYHWEVGASLSYAQLTTLLDQTVVEMLEAVYTMPLAFSTNPPSLIPVVAGGKIMPGTITVEVVRA